MAEPFQHQPPRPLWTPPFMGRFMGRAGLASFGLFAVIAIVGICMVAFVAVQGWPAALGGGSGSSAVLRVSGHPPASIHKVAAGSLSNQTGVRRAVGAGVARGTR